MAEVHGSHARIYANGLDISAQFREAESGTDRELNDTTGFTSTAESHIASPVGKGMFSASGMLEVDASDGSHEIEAMLQAACDDLGGDSVLVHMMRDTTIGDPGFIIVGSSTRHSVGTPHAEVATTKFDAQSNLARWCNALHPKAARTAAHNTARLDNTVASAAGGVSALQVFAISGAAPVITIKVQHDDNDNNWVDLVTHTAINTAGVAAGYRDIKEVAGTIDRGLRIDLAVTSGSLTSITFALQFARN